MNELENDRYILDAQSGDSHPNAMVLADRMTKRAGLYIALAEAVEKLVSDEGWCDISGSRGDVIRTLAAVKGE